MHLFYDPAIEGHPQSWTLSEEESGHAVRVLRLRAGDHLALLNGRGVQWEAQITDAHPKHCALALVGRQSHPLDEQRRLHLLVAPTKNMDRMEWLIEKAVEVGLYALTFVQTARGERDLLKAARLEKVAVAALKQSRQYHLPRLNGPVPLAQALAELTEPSRLIAELDPQAVHLPARMAKVPTAVLIGPEGGFGPEELRHAIAAGCQTVQLGQSRLRTETAALAACMVWNAQWWT